MTDAMLADPSDVKRITAKSVHEQVAQELREKITLGLWAPGHQLPAERVLARRLGVGRQTVRDALRILAEEGRVTLGGDRSAAIVATTPNAGELSDLPKERKEELMQLAELRELLEERAATLAASKRGAEHLGRMTKAQGDMRTALVLRQGDQFRVADASFHLAIAAASQNVALFEAILETRSKLFPLLDEVAAQSETLGDSLHEHERILQAIMDSDAEKARQEMLSHLRRTRDRVQNYLGPAPDDEVKIRPGATPEI